MSSKKQKSDALSFEEKIKSEKRICSQCKYEIENPALTRCPRCSTEVPRDELFCSACLYNKNCHFVHF